MQKVSAGTPREEIKMLQKAILNLSRRIAQYAPPMKPFVRFSPAALWYIKDKDIRTCPQFLWDFDYFLEQVLLNALCRIATPDQICALCVWQWKDNLKPLYEQKKAQLEQLTDHDTYFFNFTPRTTFITERLKPGSRLLYVGCGVGTECLALAKKGFRVVGIDTNQLLVNISNGFAKKLNLPFKALCMDIMQLGFKPRSFDSFLLEFYGSWPLLSQTIALQRQLACVLNDNGKGFIIANRKKYMSYYFKMRSFYSPALSRWLIPQTRLDLFFSETDACEARLLYGLYNRCHTTESLRRELNHSFDILECMYEEYDPRYVIAVVKSKRGVKLSEDNQRCKNKKISVKDICIIKKLVGKVEKICDILESHERKLTVFFEHADHYAANPPLPHIDTDVSEFIEILQDIKQSVVGKEASSDKLAV